MSLHDRPKFEETRNMVNELKVHYRGVWWLPEEPGRRIRGSLSVGGNLELTLEDSLKEPPPAKDGIVQSTLRDTWDTLTVIHGMTTDGEEISLLEAWGGSILLPIDMTHTETWRARAVLTGAHVLESDLFTEIRISTDYLWDWTNSDQHHVNWDISSKSVTITGTSTSLCKIRVNGALFELVAAIKTQPYGRNGFQIEDEAVWIVTRMPGLNWDETLKEVVIPLQSFATLCTSKANRVTRLSLVSGITGKSITVVTNLRGHDLPIRNDRRHPEYFQLLPARIFLTAPHAILQRWFTAWNELRDSLGRLLSVEYATSIYLEHRLASVVHAAEGMHNVRWNSTKISKSEYRSRRRRVMNRCPPDLRTWLHSMLLGKNNVSLSDRLRDIVHRAAAAGFPYVIPDEKKFVSALSASRNRTAHGNSAGDDYERQYWLSEGLTWLLLTLILVDLGLKPEQISPCLDQNLQLSHTARTLGWPKPTS